MKKFQIIIVGGGASGLFCALRLAEEGLANQIAVLEKNDRVGKKLSATGNGQGNVTNENFSKDHYFSSSGDCSFVLEKFGKDDLLNYFQKLGGLFISDEIGRVYPMSKQASSLTDLLRFSALKAGISIITGEKVIQTESSRDGFVIKTEKNEYFSDFLVLACGGKASAHFGSDGSGYKLAESFGHSVTKLAPSLVRLRTERENIRGLKGIRSNCSVVLKRDNQIITEQTGDVLFTDNGVSGDAIFRTSAFASVGDYLYIDFMPSYTENFLQIFLNEKAERYPEMRAEDLLRCIINSGIGRVLLKTANIPFNMEAAKIIYLIPKITKQMKRFALKIIGTDGFENAQVTKGGIPLFELDDFLMSTYRKNLFIIGELADVDGECGGYNLQWAFSSGAVTASQIANLIKTNQKNN